MIKDIIVKVDSREKYPLLFPEVLKIWDTHRRESRILSVSSAQTTLQSGDYVIEGFEDVVAVERKGSPRELSNNFDSKDSVRQGRAFKKLQENHGRKLLLIECSLSELCVDENQIIISRVMSAVNKFDLDFMFVHKPKSIRDRRVLGSMVLQYLVGKIGDRING